MLDILVLGSVNVRERGRDLPLGGPKQRALLARLTFARGRPLAPSRLISELWDEVPRDPIHALQARISRLRAATGAQLEMVDGGYILEPSSIRSDAAQFEQLYELGGSLLASGQYLQGAEKLHEALSLWRGQAYAGVHEIPVLQAEAVRLDTLHFQALADRIDVDLAVGRGAQIIPELHSLVERHPFFERFWGQLMAALYGSGRMPEALKVFSDAREAFSARLGVEPSATLGRIHTQILREQPAESLLQLPLAVPVVATMVDPAEVPDAAPARSVSSTQLDELLAVMRARRAVILTGPAGVGKSHLLKAVRTHFESRHVAAPLLSASRLSQPIPVGVFAGVGDVFTSELVTPAALIDHFSRNRSTTVLLVDNVEHLDDASLFVVTQLLRSSQLPAILTTRDLLSAPEEIRALYDAGELIETPVGALTDSDAEQLIAGMLDGPVTPSARSRILSAGRGNPLHLREIVTGSLNDDCLVRSEHGWELRGELTPTPRLTQLVGERFTGLDDACLEAASRVAIAGEFPADALSRSEHSALSRADVLEYAGNGWIRLSHPLDFDFLRARCSSVLWHDLTAEVVRVLLGGVAADRPEALRRAHILALDLDGPIDVDATLRLAEHALAAFDERLALRAAAAVAAKRPELVDAHRLAGLAASSLGEVHEADRHFEAARLNCTTSAETTVVALAYAQHLGARRLDAAAAFAVIQEVLKATDDRDEVAHLGRAAGKWAAVAGHSSGAIAAPAAAPDAAAALGLITAGMSGVVTGPLDDAVRAVALLRRVPGDIIELIPGGSALIDLTEIMVLSNNGDVRAARRHLKQKIAGTRTASPESVGMWEYALGFMELLSGELEDALLLGASAAAHLKWRDTTGLLPAAHALAGAAARATGRSTAAHSEFDAIPATADHDPKVVMLRAWASAWQQHTAGQGADAARTLIDAAGWLLAAQHNYFAGMLAHCAARIGEGVAEAVAIMGSARAAAGGGLLELVLRHGEATLAGDVAALETIASEANELGMMPTAADTWFACDELTAARPPVGASGRRPRDASAGAASDRHGMALWHHL